MNVTLKGVHIIEIKQNQLSTILGVYPVISARKLLFLSTMFIKSSHFDNRKGKGVVEMESTLPSNINLLHSALLQNILLLTKFFWYITCT